MENRKVRRLVVEAIEGIEKNVRKFSVDLSRDCIENDRDEDIEEFPIPNRLLKYIEEQIDAENRKISKLETLKKIIIGVYELDRLLDGFQYKHRQLSFGDFMGDFTDSGTEKKNTGRTIATKEDIRESLDKLKTAINEEISFLEETDWNWGQIKICEKICEKIEIALCDFKMLLTRS